MWQRLFGMALVGGLIYALEIPAMFSWIEKRTQLIKTRKYKSLVKTYLALLYFNPLWIARHFFFIKLFSGRYDEIGFNLIQLASLSYMINIPISLVGNYIIQVKIPFKQRFIASMVFSALMAIYYALSETLF